MEIASSPSASATRIAARTIRDRVSAGLGPLRRVRSRTPQAAATASGTAAGISVVFPITSLLAGAAFRGNLHRPCTRRGSSAAKRRQHRGLPAADLTSPASTAYNVLSIYKRMPYAIGGKHGRSGGDPGPGPGEELRRAPGAG